MKAMLQSGFLLMALGHVPAMAESNEEWGRRLRSNLNADRVVREFKEQAAAQKALSQRITQAWRMGEDGSRQSLGGWDEVARRQNVAPQGSSAPATTPTRDTLALVDAATGRGDFTEALRLLTEASAKSPSDQELLVKMNMVRAAKLANEVHEANSRRGVELDRILIQAEKNLPQQLRMPSPTVALADVIGDPPSDAMVVDLRGVQSYVVDPAFFKTAATGGNGAVRRFIEPPEPGKSLSALAFSGSPYATVFESPEYETLMLSGLRDAPVKEPGDVHRAREAFLRKVDDLPSRLIHVVTTANEQELEASRLKVKAAYEDYRKRRRVLLAAAANASLRQMRSMLQGMEDEGLIKPGDNLLAKTEGDPLLKATIDDRARLVRWHAELYLDEAEEVAYREMADRVTRIMKESAK